MTNECDCGSNCLACDECNRPECKCKCDGDLEIDACLYNKPTKVEEGLELFS